MVKVSFKFMKLYLALFILLLAGCSWSPEKPPSLLVIAVEGLSFDSFSCTSEVVQSGGDFSGFKVFCDEAVRFTHAYAPSTLSQPTIASLLTGLYPSEHKVRNQSSDYLSGKFQTVAEQAVASGYRTNFISGGAPIWRKSGFAQGFEMFEDNISVSETTMYRPFEKSARLFLTNLKNRIKEDSFFAFIYANDLMFPETTTTNAAGEIRSQTVRSQLMEVSESLNHLVNVLKRIGRWDNTNVVLVGLNGGLFSTRPGEERGYSLYSDNIQVQLFMKPTTKKRDLGLQWTIDRNVSLVDVGRTLYELVGGGTPRNSDFEVFSLANVLKAPQVDWPEERIIVSESAWPSWQGVGVDRYSLRQDQYLLIHDQVPKLYNTLIDRAEVTRIQREDPLVRAPMEKFKSFLEQHKMAPWRPLPETLSEKLAIARELWMTTEIDNLLEQRLKHIAKKRMWDTQIVGWQARDYIQDYNWKQLGILAKDAGVNSWRYLAAKQMGQSTKKIRLKGCEKTLENFEDVPSLRDCDDPVFSALAAWVREKDPNDTILLKENFLRQYQVFLLDQTIAKMNFQNGLTWAVDKKYPTGPSLSELALALPRMEGFRRQVQARLAREDL